jgi:hypothetical protein
MKREPAAYIITSNRGRRYLAFAGSVEHQNAAMFGYKMEARKIAENTIGFHKNHGAKNY